MPRSARIVLPELPHHVTQRGHNRQDIFPAPDDFQRYLATLREFKQVFEIKVLAYCLMTNHVHLILQPGPDTAGLGLLMKRLAGRQTRWFNRQHGRSGTLWESRYKSSPIETDRYLLACSRYVELNPVRAAMVERPADYAWSSYRQRTGPEAERWLDADPCFEALGATDAVRRERYAAFVAEAAAAEELTLIREAARRGQVTGGAGFIARVEAMAGHRIGRTGPGRPKRPRDPADHRQK